MEIGSEVFKILEGCMTMSRISLTDVIHNHEEVVNRSQTYNLNNSFVCKNIYSISR